MILKTERTFVRDFSLDDLGDLHEIFGNDEVMKNCEPAYDRQKSLEFLQDFCIGKQGGLACALKETGKVIGYILFKEGEPGVYEIGWIFNRNYWKMGYAYEACHALMDYVFDSLNAHKVFAEAIDGVKSVGLMKKLGMKPEGIWRKHTLDNDGNWADLYFYGMLREDWAASRR